MSDGKGATSIKVIPFSGKAVDWPVWSEKFLARARRKGYKKILLGTVSVPSDDEDLSQLTADEIKEKEKLRELNEDAYEDLILSINGETEVGRVVFQLVRGAKTKKLADGDAKEAWDRLRGKYEARTAPSRLLLKSKIQGLRLKYKQDPEIYISELEDLVLQYNQAGGSWKDDEILEHICGNLPSVYEVVIHPLEKKIGAKSDPLTLKELREELKLKYQKLNGGKYGGTSGDNEGEIGLFAGGFKGKCHNCGKHGHKFKNCKEVKDNQSGNKSDGNNTNNKKNGDVECYYCHEKGHYKTECPRLKKRVAKEKANAAVEKIEEGEVSLTTIDLSELKDVAFQMESSPNQELFIADSGASVHLTGSLKGMTNLEELNDDEVIVGDGNSIRAVKIGDKKVTIIQEDGKERDVILRGCKYVPKLGPFSLFSLTDSIDKGHQLGNEGRNITIRKGNFKLKFDRVIKTKSGYVCGIMTKPMTFEDVATPTLNSKSTVDVNYFHDLLGHFGEDKTRAVAKYYGIKLKGKFNPCSDCAKAKARQANIPKSIEDGKKSTIPGERLFFDISSIKSKSFGGAKFWLLIIDDATGQAFSYFLKKKSETARKIVGLIKHLESTLNYKVKFLRCDNAGENIATEHVCKEEGLGVIFEYTAPNTPQQNGRVERRFATLYGRVRSMLNAARFSREFRRGLWAECARTACELDNLDCDNKVGKPRYEQFFGKDYKPFPYLRKFGEIGVVTKGKDICSKLINKGEACLYLGHAENHSAEVARFMKLSTKRVICSRDIKWLEKTFQEYQKSEGLYDDNDDISNASHNSEEEEENEEEEEEEGRTEQNEPQSETVSENVQQIPWLSRTTRSGTRYAPYDEPIDTTKNESVRREMQKLSGFFNPEASKVAQEPDNVPTVQTDNLEAAAEDDRLGRDATTMAINQLFGDLAFFCRNKFMQEPDIALYSDNKEYKDLKTKLLKLHILDGLDYLNDEKNNMKEDTRAGLLREYVQELKGMLPNSYDEAWNHPDEKFRKRWRIAIRKEIKSLVEVRKVWRVIRRSSIPKGRRCVKSKWVFDLKRSGLFKVRLVACGYSQIPGVDFTESYAPVINDVSWRILIIAMLVWKLEAKIIDVSTAFLYGDLEEEVYMSCSEVHKEDEALYLIHSIYGLVQSARQYYLKFTEKLKKLGFKGGYPDPCLMLRENDNGICIIAIWVDDSLLVGHSRAIKQTIDDLKKEGFDLKLDGSLDDYLSCEITFDKEKNKGWIHQPHLITKLEKKFGEYVKGLQKFKTPGTPGLGTLRNTKIIVGKVEHALYRSGVGMLLYLVKHTRPDISNAVRELSKALDSPSPAAYKEMLRVIKYVLDTRNLALKVAPTDVGTNEWKIIAFSDSDFGGDKETRISIAGFILYLMDVPISWRSKGQKSVTLSSSEAEYVALSEATKEIKFVYQLLVGIGIKVKLPIIVRVDNLGAMFMSENVSVSQRTKHVDIRYRFVQEFVLDGFIKVVFVKTADNDADIFTKNLGGELHDRHSRKMIIEKGKT